MLRPASVGGNKWEVNLVLLRAGERDLRLLSLFFDALQGIRLLAQVHALFPFKFIQYPVDNAIVPIVATEVGVTVRGFDFEDAIADFKDGDIERPAAEVIHSDLLVLLLVQAISQ